MVAQMSDLLTTSEAARVAGVSSNSIRVWLRAGLLTAQSTPLGALIDPTELGQVIAAREQSQRERAKTRQLGGGTDA